MAACRRFVLFKPLTCNMTLSSIFFRTCNSNAGGSASTQPDPLPIFAEPRMQALLRRVTGFDIVKINKAQKVAFETPTYRLLTDAQLLQLQDEAEEKARLKLQMPPVLAPRKPIDTVLSLDPEIGGLNESKFVLVDISYGLPDRKRKMAVRETDGTLRSASWEERDRLNQTYNQKEGRQLFVPEMFNFDSLEALLRREKYVYVLDRACVQFEPDDPVYIQVCHRVYEVVNAQRHFDVLRSTRHFGPLVFYLAWYKRLENLLVDCLESHGLNDAVDVVRVYHLIHPHCESLNSCSHNSPPLTLLQAFVDTETVDQGELQLALQSYADRHGQKMSAGNT